MALFVCGHRGKVGRFDSRGVLIHLLKMPFLDGVSFSKTRVTNYGLSEVSKFVSSLTGP